MTRKQPKPPTAPSKKRPTPDRKPAAKAAAAPKKAAAPVREKDAAKPAVVAAKKPVAGAHSAAHAAPHPAKSAEVTRDGSKMPGAVPVNDGKSVAKHGSADKKAVMGLARLPAMTEDRQSQLKLLIARGKEQGYLTYAQVNDHLPSEIVDPEQIEDIVNTINDMGIPVYEKAPDTESLLSAEPSAPADEEAIEEAAAALAALDAELGRTTDPVRMYMREMGTVELLTREGEIRIAKRIEEGLDAVRSALAMYPATFDFLLKAYEPVKAGQARLVDVIVGFIDPNAPDVIAQPQNPTKVEIVAADEKSEDDEEGDEDGESEEEEAVDTGPDPVE